MTKIALCIGCKLMCDSDSLFPLCPECEKKAQKFWDIHNGKGQEHLCDLTDKQFNKRHKNVLRLKEDRTVIGTLLMGDYYLGGFSSRSCSERMASLMGNGDYLSFYCGSSSYLIIKMGWMDEKIRMAYEKADKKDRNEKGEKK
jgi:hypothetical protein